MLHALSFWAKFSCVDSAILHTALRLGLFEHLLNGGGAGLTIAQLSERLPASVRGTRVIVEPLVGSRLLARDDEGQLTVAPDYVAPLRDLAFRAQLDEAIDWWGVSRCLTTAVQSNAPVAYAGREWDLLGRYAGLFAEGHAPLHGGTAAEELFDRVARHYLRTQALSCAADLSLLERVQEAGTPLAQLAEASGVPAEGLAVLLNTLARMGIFEVDADGYRYHPDARKVLNARSVASYSQGVGLITDYWDALGRLEEAVVHDRRTINFNNAPQGEQYYLKLARYNTAIFPAYFGLIREIPKTLQQVRSLAQADVLDVGAGSGVWGTAFAHAEPTTRVTFFDQPQVLAQTRRNVERLKLSDRAHFWPGNLLDADFGIACFDVILLGQICHTQDPSDLPHLFRRLARALRPGGWLLLADSILNDRRDAPLDYLYFGIKMFVATSGEVLSLSEYSGLLADAGLVTCHCHKIPGTGIDVMMASHEPHVLPDTLEVPALRAVQL